MQNFKTETTLDEEIVTQIQQNKHEENNTQRAQVQKDSQNIFLSRMYI